MKNRVSQLSDLFQYLHDETFETCALKSVRIIIVELKIVVEDEAGLHVGGHADADRHGPYKKLKNNRPGETKGGYNDDHRSSIHRISTSEDG